MLTNWGSVGARMSEGLGDLGQSADPSESDRQIWEIVAYTMSGLSGVLLIMSLIMARRIKASSLGNRCRRRGAALAGTPVPPMQHLQAAVPDVALPPMASWQAADCCGHPQGCEPGSLPRPKHILLPHRPLPCDRRLHSVLGGRGCLPL
jgi:hypothetical protein